MDKAEKIIQGLTTEQVLERKNHGQINLPVDSGAKSNLQIVRDNLFTYFNFIFLFLAILVCIVGSFKSLTFLPVIIGNLLIGIIQEIRAKNVVEKMNFLNAPHSIVIRDGEQKKIVSEDIVKDDYILFHAGDQIPVDAIILQGIIRVNEGLLTGEADEIEKSVDDKLLSGSFVVSGSCLAIAKNVGKNSYISQLTLEAKSYKKKEQSEMIRSINRLIMWVGIIIIPVGLTLFYQGFFINHVTFKDSIISMVAAIIGMIPEGLYLLTTVALAVSTMRLAKKKVLLHDMKSIESLARVDILCVDKTGTITENKMSVFEIIEIESHECVSETLRQFVNDMTVDNITMQAMKEYYQERIIDENIPNKKVINMTSFSSETKYCSVTYEDGAYVLGAPEVVLREQYSKYINQIKQYISDGYRIVVFGKYLGEVSGKELTETVIPQAFVLLSNPIRNKAKETFHYFDLQGVSIKVISGDNPETVSKIALKAGIKNAEKYIDATLLKNDIDIEQAIRNYTVFGRVTPRQKQMLVKAWQKAGHTVAMTGDGVNDILALRDADCSVAMASGSEAAAQAAQVVLLDSDFSSMPFVVMEGRRVVNNIQRSASLFLVKNIFSLLLAIFSVVLFITYPLEPSQVSLISLFNIGIPAFFLAMEPNNSRIEDHFLKKIFLRALPAGLTDVLAIGSLVICGIIFKLPEDDIATAATILLAIIGFMILIKITRPLNRYRTIILIGNLVGFILVSTLLSSLFALQEMSASCILLFVIFAFASESLFRILTNIVEKLEKRIEMIICKRKNKRRV